MFLARIMVLTGFLLIAWPASAEFYRYRDADGNLRYTDDITQVPVDQRPKIKALEAVEPAIPDGKRETNSSKADQSSEQATPVTSDTLQELEGVQKRLAVQQAELDEEGAVLKKEKADLEEMQRKFRGLEGRRLYEKKAAKFKEKLDAYNQKLKSYEDAYKDFNEKAEEYKKSVPR